MERVLKRFCILLLISLLGLCILRDKSFAAEASEVNEPVTITLSATGDCTIGWDVRYQKNLQKYYNQYGNNYFFKKVKTIFAEDDLTLVNFEGTLTARTKRRNKKFTFRAPKVYGKILNKGNIEVVNLANNHSEDFGYDSYLDTVNTMKANDIGYCRNTAICYKKIKGVKMAFLGFDIVDGTTQSQVKKMIQRAKNNHAKIIVVSFHWGIEYQTLPNSKQKNLGHLAIDEGASLVIGHHPHILQGIETYKGKHILYSMGNFCFGGNSNPRDKDTMIYQETFTVKDSVLTKCSGNVIPCSLSSHTGYNDFQPRVLSGTAKDRVIRKLNDRSKNLKTKINDKGQVLKK